MQVQDLSDQFDAFLDEAHRLKARYASQITILVGCETDNITAIDLDQLYPLLQRSRGRIEYIVGSIHHVGGIPIDFDVGTFNKALAHQPGQSEDERMENLLCSYFEAQFQLLEMFHPEIIGHIDLCRLYNPDLRLTDYPRAWTLLGRNISYAIAYGALFEVNAAAFRKNWNTAYPAEDVLKVRASLFFISTQRCIVCAGDPPKWWKVGSVRRQPRSSRSWTELSSFTRLPPASRRFRAVVPAGIHNSQQGRTLYTTCQSSR